MVKIAMGSVKYVIHGTFRVSGIIDKNDLIGSFYGQTEGLIGEDLDFSKLLKMGKLGRIEVSVKKSKGKTSGTFKVPTALDKVEVSLLAAALESIDKIGHCSGSISISNISDERDDKRKQVLKRAEELLKNLKGEMPESKSIRDGVSSKIQTQKMKEYLKNKVYGGPNVSLDKEVILVEGKADVSNLLKQGFSNVLSINEALSRSF